MRLRAPECGVLRGWCVVWVGNRERDGRVASVMRRALVGEDNGASVGEDAGSGPGSVVRRR